MTSENTNKTDRLRDYEQKHDLSDQARKIKELEINGTVIIFDLTGSTQLKVNKKFPNWLPDLIKFYNIIHEYFEEKTNWNKFLGDARMLFFPDKELPGLSYLPPNDIIELCEKVMNAYWDYYSIYSKNKKGQGKDHNFRQMTCAIDYGDEIINWYQAIDDNYDSSGEVRFDPIGAPIDRCFRISGIAGPGQLLISNSFYNKLKETKKETLKNIERISLAKESLKGFPEEKHVCYLMPPKKQIEYLLDEVNVELVEKAVTMTTKVKIRLLRNAKKQLDKYSNENTVHKKEK